MRTHEHLVINPRSGDDSPAAHEPAEAAHEPAEAAHRRGIATHLLEPGEDPGEAARAWARDS